MRIAFVGKGGAGKTTLSALFSRYLASQGLPVLAIDADINQHLGETLGMSAEESRAVPPLGIEAKKIKEYLRGENPRITSVAAMMKTTPPGTGSRLINFDESNPIFSYFERNINGVRFMATGPFSEADLGVACYHSKVGAVELLLNHLVDKENRYVIVDMTAGADSFASGIFTKFDMTFLVAEPTRKAIGVYEQYRRHANDYGVNLAVVGNKAESSDDLEFLKRSAGNSFLAALMNSKFVRASERGEKIGFAELEPENAAALAAMRSAVDAQRKDWDKFYRHAVEFHIRNAESWANAEAGEDLRKQVDSDFVFPVV